MFLSKIAMKNLRKYIDTTVDFHKGLNALIGENNSGKSAIIDAIKIVFNTQSAESIRVTDDDFHISENNARSSELSINCVIEDLSDDEAKNFIEYASFTKSSETSSCNVKIYLYFRAWKEGNRIFSSLRAGNPENGPFLDGRARELLKCVYLRPLRDAEREMHSGKNSRISQILYNHPLFIDKEDNKLVDILKNANNDILWLLSREKTLPEVLRRAHDYAFEALIWLVDDGIARAVDVDATMPRPGLLALAVKIFLPDDQDRNFTYKMELGHAF